MANGAAKRRGAGGSGNVGDGGQRARTPGEAVAERAKRGGPRASESGEREVYLNLVRTHAMLSTGFARLFKEHGISEPQYGVLRIVDAASRGGGGRTMEGIAADMVARDPDVTRLVDRLEARGLVERRRSDEDRRVVIVRMTAKGRGLLRTLREPVSALHKEQLGHLGARRLRELSALLSEARSGG